ncbi:MAG: ABC transporter ATP-binding protein [Crenarchaeota archaeon]|nr:ABC transporter ATP-binding protein [Thermoproteota archaeon]
MVDLNINGVDCYYDSVKIVKDVSFAVRTGDFFGILGPNGSGKTTLLKSISRLLKPRKGTIILEESNIYQLNSVDLAKKLAVVPQEANVAFNFTALEIVLMGRTPHLSRFAIEGTKDVEIAKKAMEYTDTWHLANRLITELSGGEKQRIIIARALTQEPKVLLLDEPTSHLDINNQLEIMDLIKKLCNQKKLVVVGVFHDFNLAARYCDSIMLLKDGKIVAIGKTSDVLNNVNIKNVFGIDTVVNKHPITDQLYVIPISKSKEQSKRNFRIHLVCGAGTGSCLMKQLIDEGYNVSAGVLNLLDTDQLTANFLKIPIIIEAPLSPITDDAYFDNLNRISKSDALVLTSFPIGKGNIKNLDVADFALDKKIPTLILDDVPIDTRDFTEKQATITFQKLKNKGAIVVKNHLELFSILNNLLHTQSETKDSVKYVDQRLPEQISIQGD